MKKLALVLSAVVATVACGVTPLVVAAAPAPAAALPDYTPPPVQFGACSSAALVAARAECGFVTVPVDYANPTGATIQLAISRVRHKSPDAQYQGLMIVVPDGPGDSALGLSRLQSRVPNSGGNDYDWIGYDPRGVGDSQPTLTCQPGYFATPRPDYTKYEFDALQPWQARNGMYASSCAAQQQSDLFGHMTTREHAYDLDSIRKALGQPKVNLYGFGYGAYLAEVYATFYPALVNKAVLDSPLDPTETGSQRSKDRSPATDTALQAFFGWIARYDGVYGLGTTADAVQTRWTDTRTELAAANAGETIGPDEWTELFLPAAATTDTWPDLAGVFAFWQQQHNPSALADAQQTSAPSNNAYAVRNAVRCTDDQAWPAGDRAYFDDTVDTVGRAPLSGAANAWLDAPCSAWPFDAQDQVPVTGPNVAPVLIVSETLDALAPYPGSVATRAAFPNARLVEGVGGTTHASSLDGSDCLTNAVSRYLLNGTLPDRVSGSRSDRQCEPNPQPPAGSVPAEYRPGVIIQPQPQTVTEGSSVTFTAAAAGPPAATVQWQVSDDDGDTYTDILGADDESYTLDDNTVERSGNLFRAVFTNTQGQDTSKAALLTVNSVPTITTQPADQAVTAGGTASFTAEADGTPEPTVQWQRSTDNGATFTDIADATETTYEFAVVAADNGTRYRAVFTNDGGTVTSAAATLTVDTVPAFGTGTTLPTATVGKQYRAQITTSGRPKPTERVTAGSLPPGLRLVGDPVLTGTPTRAGSYRFTLTSTNTAGRASRTFDLVVRAAPATSTAAPDPSASDTPTGSAPTSSAAAPATSSPAAAERATAQTGTDLVPTLAAGASALLLGLVLVLMARRRRTQGRHHA